MTPEYIDELANWIDPEGLWQLDATAQRQLPEEQRRRLDAAVALRRYADDVAMLNNFIGTGKSLLITAVNVNTTAVKEVDTPEEHKRLGSDRRGRGTKTVHGPAPLMAALARERPKPPPLRQVRESGPRTFSGGEVSLQNIPKDCGEAGHAESACGNASCMPKEKVPPGVYLSADQSKLVAVGEDGVRKDYPIHNSGEPLVRFCPDCGAIGEVPEGKRDCCPDGSHARYVPESMAHHCQKLFKDLLQVHEDQRRLVRELDVVLNGHKGAARQASLVDLVSQCRHRFKMPPFGAVHEHYKLNDFAEGQWWVAELDKIAGSAGAANDLKRAVAVVHNMLRAITDHTQGMAPGHPLPDWPEDLNSFAERKAYQRGVADGRRTDPRAARWEWLMAGKRIRGADDSTLPGSYRELTFNDGRNLMHFASWVGRDKLEALVDKEITNGEN